MFHLVTPVSKLFLPAHSPTRLPSNFCAEIQTATTLVQYQLFIELPPEQARTAANLVGRVGEATSAE